MKLVRSQELGAPKLAITFNVTGALVVGIFSTWTGGAEGGARWLGT